MGRSRLPWLSLAWVAPCAAQGPMPVPSSSLQLLPCAQHLPRCASACGVTEFQALHEWLLSTPQQADQIGPKASLPSDLERGTLQLIKDIGLSALASSLDYLMLCQHSDPRCGVPLQHFEPVQMLRALLDAQLRELVQDYRPDTGLRSPVLRVGHSLRSDLDGFLRQLRSLEPGLQAAEVSARLVQTAGLRARMLAWHLGMHFWVRDLAVPGRGAPVLVLHDEYTSFTDMVSVVIGTMVRNGQPQLAMAELGVPTQEEWLAPQLLRSVPGLQYVAIMLEPPEEQHGAAKFAVFEQLRAELQQSELHQRLALHFAASPSAAAAMPDRSLDLALLDLRGADASFAQEQMALWESKVKPAGVLLGRGFEPDWPEIVKAVCAQRFSTDLHLGAGGGFWWLVEPPEDE
ncbi:unnamed protein product [Effrenium voratum]|nr:unnamed protein product [Effrenium voratum]